MAIFSRTKKTDKAPETASETKAVTTALSTDRNLASVIVQPVTRREKALTLAANNVYTFIVRKDATKYDIADAITALYNVTPVKVNTVTKATRARKNGRTGKMVTQKGEKKAYVYLKDGDSITFA